MAYPRMLNQMFIAIAELQKTNQFRGMDPETDEDEHSIEMHLPYVRKVFEGYIFCCSLISYT